MKITDVTLSILRTELEETVIPTHGAVDAMPALVLVSVSTAEGIDGNFCLQPFGSGMKATRRSRRRPKPLSAIPIPCATGCVASRNARVGRCPGHGM